MFIGKVIYIQSQAVFVFIVKNTSIKYRIWREGENAVIGIVDHLVITCIVSAKTDTQALGFALG